ncbi:surfeit locus protein 4 homolog [Sycon ciliatum]|uniref:surfeit locus protein 4 homolog n=1 Tax=Sycon ciliatum TaxID=27933 RepID=UPI0020AEB249|eukprot:scpid77176/ scgid18708/ Surfeit locus protein 4 homolog
MASNEVLKQAEDAADRILRQSKHVLPHLAHLFLVATFLEDGFRMFFQWTEQADYIESTWNCGSILSNLFVILNLFGQLVGGALVMIRMKVEIGVGTLFGVVILQTLAYSILWNLHFFLRNLALSGGLLLLLAEIRDEGKSMFAGVPSVGGNKSRTYMQLTGRLLLVLMFLTVFSFEDVAHIIFFVIGLILVLLVAIGFKAKLSALVLTVILFVGNLLINDWWSLAHNSPLRDFIKYDFFQMLSVIGGLLLVVTLGPGGVSFDEHKKMW